VPRVNDQNGVSRETVTNGVGEYSFPAIESAKNYIVRASVQGFESIPTPGRLPAAASPARCSAADRLHRWSRSRIQFTLRFAF
jgi:hypothetical protein